MKKWLVGLVLAVVMIGPAFAHPGGTDGKGGHYDRSSGDYHYHHGYGAHGHVDGVCPYDYDDKTGERSGSSSSSSSSSLSGALKKNYDQAGLTSIYQTLQKGDRGNDVADLQKRLNRLGYSVGAADGVFGSRTVAAVKQFQKDNGINATGNVSHVTLAALFPELAPTATTRPTAKPAAALSVATASVQRSATENPVDNDWEMNARLAKAELERVKTMYLGYVAFSVIGGLCCGLAVWIVQVNRSQRQLREKEQYYLKQTASTEARVLAQWKKQLDDELPDHVVAVNSSLVWYHRVKSPCTHGSSNSFKNIVVTEAIASGRDPCPFCKPMSIRGAEQWRLQRERHVEDERRKALQIENQQAERERIEAEVRREQERREYRLQAEIALRRKSVQQAMQEETQPDLSEGIVYISRDGIDPYYHHWEHCGKVQNPILASKRRVQVMGFVPCQCCDRFNAPEHDVFVYIATSHSGKCYHTKNSWCLTWDETVSLQSALEMGYKPCERCHPPKEIPKVWF